MRSLKFAHDCNERAATSNNDVGPVGIEAGVEEPVTESFGGKSAKDIFGSIAGESEPVELIDVEFCESEFNHGNGDDGSGNTDDFVTVGKLGNFA